MLSKYQCDRCESCVWVDDIAIYYTLSDGREFPKFAGVGWCSVCRSLSEVEDICDPAALKEFMAEQDVSPSSEYGEQLTARIEWRRREISRHDAWSAVGNTSST